ncbi:sex peptide receptor-like [Magallana gigas]|uniref:sex peptide receptor-like n=1 Tax=Magallana gigas TaxID=29159 RepID=UPI003342113F
MSRGSNATDYVNEDFKEFYVQARFTTGLILYPIFCVLGLIANGLGIVVMLQKQMRSSTNVYLLALAISDGSKIICDALYFLVVLFLEIDPKIGNRLYICLYPYAHYVFNASLCISAWLTVAVAVERYVYVCHVHKVRTYCTLSRARAISFSVFIFMSLACIPYALRYKTVESQNNSTTWISYDLSLTDLWADPKFASIITWVQYFIRIIIPLTMLVVLNILIMCGIRKCRIGRKKHRITVMLIVVIIVFIICMIPDAIMSTFLGFGYHEEDYLARAIREITDLFLLINTAVNFVIYCAFNSIFWKNFKSIFCSCCISERAISDDFQMRQPLNYMVIKTPNRQ